MRILLGLVSQLILLSLVWSEDSLDSQELLKIRGLPIFSDSWVVIDETSDRGTKLTVDQIVFESSESQDLVSIRFMGTGGKVSSEVFKGGPWTEATISAFPGGHISENAKPMTAHSGSIQLTKVTNETPALAFTTYWCREDQEPLISHGYSLAIGGFYVLVQHTSERVVTPEFAEELVDELITHMSRPAGVQR